MELANPTHAGGISQPRTVQPRTTNYTCHSSRVKLLEQRALHETRKRHGNAVSSRGLLPVFLRQRVSSHACNCEMLLICAALW
eukprot:1157818-Pelagomonas_calceolata.AAC.5